MKTVADKLKEKLNNVISELSEIKTLYVTNPEKDFTRDRKLTFEKMITALISMGGNSIYKELLEQSGFDAQTATTSAFVQQRQKILPEAFEYILRHFCIEKKSIKTHKGYRLLAVDGSSLNLPTDPNDETTHFKKKANRGYNLLHLNALYDITNRLYVDAITQTRHEHNEHKAMIDMVARSPITDKVIIVGDRLFESYNNFAHIEKKGWNFVIRVKDIHSNGILSAVTLPNEDVFDITIETMLTRKQTKAVKQESDLYKFIPNKSTFDFLDLHQNKFYPIKLRFVRVKLDNDNYECLVTNLSCDEFSSKELKEVYRLRWGIETSFRELKYTIGLTNFHSKKQGLINQEIFARLILYNFTEMLTMAVVLSKGDKTYVYKVNFTVAANVCRYFLRWFNNKPPDVLGVIARNTLPLRPHRRFRDRKPKVKSAVTFWYRVA